MDIVMGFRLLIVAVAGLGAMYMMHLLAQDYDRIRRPVTKAIERALRGKREVNSAESNEVLDISVDWKAILDRDPLGCLQSLICQIVSEVKFNNDPEAVILRHFIEKTYHNAPLPVTAAYAKGLAYKGVAEGCYSEYPYCWYSAKLMLRILRWLT